MSYEDLVRNLDELDFLTPRGLRNKNYISYYVTGTYYVFYVFKMILVWGKENLSLRLILTIILHSKKFLMSCRKPSRRK